MTKTFTLLFTTLLGLLMLQGCYNDNEYDLYPFVACDSTSVTYSQTIVPIMTGSCNVCHSTTLASGGIVTDSYDGLSVVAKNGRLWGAVSHSAGFQAMPQNSSQLSDCDLGKIQIWVKAGYPNN